MILVVYSHICHFCLGDSTMAFNDVFFLFRLPCFFFISGWLFEPVAARPLRQVVGHKFMVQIVPTFIFLLLLAPPPEFFRQLGALKGGYWFTFVLFEFFLIYLFTVRCCRRGGWLLALTVTVAAFWFSSCQHQLRTVSTSYSLMPELLDAAGLLSMSMWRYYLFFYLGTWVRRHFQAFENQASSPTVIFGLTVGFCVIASTAHPASHALEFLRFTIGGTVGMLMVFVWFRLAAPWMQRMAVYRWLQYIGRRTLDIYMLHYFFLPRMLMPMSHELRAADSLPLEMLTVALLSLAVTALCLIASYVIRLNHFLGHLLFGTKKN